MSKTLVLDILEPEEINHLPVYRKRLVRILKDIKYEGGSDTCPGWECKTCKYLCPKIELTSCGSCPSCPCYEYSDTYLIKRLKEILSNWPRRRRKKK